MKSKVPSFLLEKPSSDSFNQGRGSLTMPFIEKSMHHLADVIKTGYVQWETASRDDFFQKIDARVKVLFLLFYAVIVSLKKDIVSEAWIGAFIFILALISRLNMFDLYRRVFFFGFIFGFLVALPSAFNVITKGEIIFPVLHLSKNYSFWIYRIPEEIGITREGAYGVLMLTSRVTNSVALSLLILSTTPISEIVRALKILRVPDSFLMIIVLSYKYIFIFAKTVEDMHLAKKSRLAGQVSNSEARRWIAGRIAVIFRKTRQRCEEIFKAMLSRGFADTVKITRFRKLNWVDWSTGMGLFLAGIMLLWI